jgi:hypothetical protein
MFVAINAWTWRTKPTVDDSEKAVLAVAAGAWNESDAAAWLRGYLEPSAGAT